MMDDIEYIKLVLDEYRSAIIFFKEWKSPMYFEDKKDAIIVANHLRKMKVDYSLGDLPNGFTIIEPIKKYNPTISVIYGKKIPPEVIDNFLKNYPKKIP